MLNLLLQCAPAIHPVTMAAIVQHESGGDRLAIHDNTSGQSYHPDTTEQAIALAKRLISEQHSIDVGLAQINDKNFGWLGLSLTKAFDPCANLHASQKVLIKAWTAGHHNLQAALSVYNTGTPASPRGEAYASSVYRAAGVIVPAIPGGRMDWNYSALPPVRVIVKPSPEASPFNPQPADKQHPAVWR